MLTRFEGTFKSCFLTAFSAVSFSTAIAADLPTAPEIFEKMGLGINIGNTMEVPVNPTWWGNKFPTEGYIDTVKAAGFNTIRIPCAWYSHSNAISRDSSTADIVPGGAANEIAKSWLDSVQTVVDYCMRAGLVTILNIHWDNGWLEANLNDASKDKVNERQKDFWTQIATRFRDYNENLLFASANEPATTDANYKHETEILMGYHQTFVNAVRATGGNNASRTLIIQGPSTSIDRSVEAYPASKMPTDIVPNRLMFEVHYYDPSPYTIVGDPVDWGVMVQPQYYWGEDTYATGDEAVHNCGYNPWGGGMGTPCSADDMMNAFKKMKENYVDKGIPVIIGEFGANDRLEVLTGEKYARHRKGRIGWYEAVAKAAVANKVVPIAWDTGHEGSNNMTIIQRQSVDAAVFDAEVLNAMRKVYGLGEYVNNGITHVENFVTGNTNAITTSSNSESTGNTGLSSSSYMPNPNSGTTGEIALNASSSSAIFPEQGEAPIKAQQFAKTTLFREGNMIVSLGKNAINLFDVNGNLVRKSAPQGTRATLDIQGLKSGNYIAQSGNKFIYITKKK